MYSVTVIISWKPKILIGQLISEQKKKLVRPNFHFHASTPILFAADNEA
jgi:hypothetical protein